MKFALSALVCLGAWTNTVHASFPHNTESMIYNDATGMCWEYDGRGNDPHAHSHHYAYCDYSKKNQHYLYWTNSNHLSQPLNLNRCIIAGTDGFIYSNNDCQNRPEYQWHIDSRGYLKNDRYPNQCIYDDSNHYFGFHICPVPDTYRMLAYNPYHWQDETPGFIYNHKTRMCWTVSAGHWNKWTYCDAADNDQKYIYNSGNKSLRSNTPRSQLLCIKVDGGNVVTTNQCNYAKEEYQWYLDIVGRLKNGSNRHQCIYGSNDHNVVKLGSLCDRAERYSMVTSVPADAATRPPTTSPTSPPSRSPTSPPTGSPTSPPTGSPTSPPTGSPTSPPTGSPTSTAGAAGASGVAGTNKQQPPPPAPGTGSGDPHFKTFNGHKFDFHAECDLLFLRNDGFEDGLGMEIQIRTKQERFWSFIERAVVKIGLDTLEVQGGKEGVQYWINGNLGEPLETGDEFFLSGFTVHFREVKPKRNHYFRIDLGHGEGMVISNLREYVSVTVNAKTSKQFKESVGLLGSFPEGTKYARNGTTVIEDPNEYGNEWQVLEDEPSLFKSVEGTVQAPQKCLMPPTMEEKKKLRRRLGESAMSEADAKVACSHAAKEDMDACMFDVLATNNVELAGAY